MLHFRLTYYDLSVSERVGTRARHATWAAAVGGNAIQLYASVRDALPWCVRVLCPTATARSLLPQFGCQNTSRAEPSLSADAATFATSNSGASCYACACYTS